MTNRGITTHIQQLKIDSFNYTTALVGCVKYYNWRARNKSTDFRQAFLALRHHFNLHLFIVVCVAVVSAFCCSFNPHNMQMTNKIVMYFKIRVFKLIQPPIKTQTCFQLQLALSKHMYYVKRNKKKKTLEKPTHKTYMHAPKCPLHLHKIANYIATALRKCPQFSDS